MPGSLPPLSLHFPPIALPDSMGIIPCMPIRDLLMYPFFTVFRLARFERLSRDHYANRLIEILGKIRKSIFSKNADPPPLTKLEISREVLREGWWYLSKQELLMN